MASSHSAPAAALAVPWSPRSLLTELAEEYPDLSRREVATALDRAHAIEAGLAGGAEVALKHVATLARDRLDLLRERANLAQRRTHRDLSPARLAPRTQP